MPWVWCPYESRRCWWRGLCEAGILVFQEDHHKEAGRWEGKDLSPQLELGSMEWVGLERTFKLLQFFWMLQVKVDQAWSNLLKGMVAL